MRSAFNKFTFIFFLQILLATLSVSFCHAQVLKSHTATVSFYSKAPIENIEASNSSAQSILNTDQQTIAFIIPIRGFRFKKPLMQEHFNEKYLQSDKYPKATYSGKINGAVTFNADGKYEVTSTGKMTIHGVEKEVTHPGTIIVNKDEVHLESTFKIAVKDYNIEIPRLMFRNIADTVLVTVKVFYKPYVK
jgi:hypothetical protein